MFFFFFKHKTAYEMRISDWSSRLVLFRSRLDTALKPDLTVAVRMAVDNLVAHDYYILPRLGMQQAVLRLAEHNGLSLDAYCFDTLEPFYRLCARAPLRQAA